MKARERQIKKAKLEKIQKEKEAERESKRREKNTVTKKTTVSKVSKSCNNSGYAPQHSENGVNECILLVLFPWEI